MIDRRRFAVAFSALAAGAGLPAVRAQTFPSRPITLIAPSVPGGSTDAVCRAMAEAVSRRLGVPVTVENKAGAGGSLGAVVLAGAKPDGYTVALLPLGVFRQALMQKTPFDPLRDIAYVAGLGGFVFGLAVPADTPYRTLAELLAYGARRAAAFPDTRPLHTAPWRPSARRWAGWACCARIEASAPPVRDLHRQADSHPERVAGFSAARP